MKGSEKQIEWATKIKQQIIEKMEKRVNEANIRVSEKSMPDYYSMICEIVRKKAIKGMEDKMNEVGAAYIIDRRNSLPFYDEFDNAISQTYEKVRYSEDAQNKIREMYKAIAIAV